jgi:hypothetical protein
LRPLEHIIHQSAFSAAAAADVVVAAAVAAAAVAALQEKRLISEVTDLEADTGVRVRVLAQNYPETPGGWAIYMRSKQWAICSKQWAMCSKQWAIHSKH